MVVCICGCHYTVRIWGGLLIPQSLAVMLMFFIALRKIRMLIQRPLVLVVILKELGSKTQASAWRASPWHLRNFFSSLKFKCCYLLPVEKRIVFDFWSNSWSCFKLCAWLTKIWDGAPALTFLLLSYMYQ